MQSILVSSTDDMHQERDLLHNEVIPEIKDFARAHGQAVAFQDLRWGMDAKALDSAENTIKVLQLCFDEIDASKPIVIALLGEQYGWIPQDELVQFTLNQHPRGIPSFHEKSVAELEILYGALEREDPAECLFYFRSIDNLQAMKENSPEFYQTCAASDAQDSLRMGGLKKRIRQKYPDRIREYHVNWNFEANCFDDLQEFANTVKRDILSLLARRLGPQRELSWHERLEQQFRYNFERDAVPSPLENSSFEARQLIDLLQKKAPENMLSVWVNARDRRALDICMASAALYAEQNGWDVILYDCGDSIFTSHTQKMLTYLSQELSQRMELDRTDEAEMWLPEAIERFRSLLDQYDRCGKADLLIVLRGLEKMDELNWKSWFPEEPLHHIRFLISGVNAEISPEFNRKNPSVIWDFHADQYVRLYLSKHGKRIDAETMDALLRQAKDMPARYLESALSHLLYLSMADYRSIRQSGDGIEAISTYLRQMIRRMPKTLYEQTERMIANVGGEIGLQWTQDVLGILTVLPSSIPLSHMEKLMQFGGQSWSQLQIAWMLRKLGFLLSDTLDGHLRLSCDDARRDLQDILLLPVSKWQYIIASYMETVSPSDEFYRSQYLLLAHMRGDSKALWHYLERCDESDFFPNLLHLLRRCNGTAWLVRSLDQINSDPMLAEKHLLWCARTLYPWLKEQELCTEEFLPAWTSLSETARKRYQQNMTHDGNECLFLLLFVAGEQNWKLHRTEAAVDSLERAIAIAEEDLRRWPNHIYCMMKRIRQDGVEPERFGLVCGDELVDALAERSYSSFVRIAFRYLNDLYCAQGNLKKAKFAKTEYEKYTHLADPNPTNELKKTIAPGVTMIMPEAFKDMVKHPEEKERSPYRPDLRRNTAIQQAKEAIDCIKRGEYQKALELFHVSNEMLLQIHDDGKTGELYSIDCDPPKRDKLVRIVASECLRDLELNYDGILRCFYALKMFDECKASIRQGVAYCREFDRIRNSEESKEDLVNCLSVAVQYCNSLNDAQGLYESACELFSACCEAVRKTGRFDSDRQDQFSIARSAIMGCIEAMPQKGTDLFSLLLRLARDSAQGHDSNSYIQLAELCRDLLLWMLDHGEYWKTEEWTAEVIATTVMLSISQVYHKHGLAKMLYEITDCLEALPGRLKDDGAKYNCAEMLSLVGFRHFCDGEYARAVQLFQLALQLRKALPQELHSLLDILQDYSHLLPALSEAGRYEDADRIGHEALSFAQKVEELGYGDVEKAHGRTAAEFQNSLISTLAEINLNLGLNYSNLGNLDAMDSYLEASKRYALQMQDESKARPILKRINSLRDTDLRERKDKQDAVQIRDLIAKINRLLAEIKDGRPNRARLGEIGDQIYEHTKSIEQIDASSYMLEATTLAWYYHWCGKIFLGIDMKEKARAATLKAKEYIENVKDTREYYAEIYTNMSALTADEGEQLRYEKKAIQILEELQKTHQLRDEHSLAMAYHNYGIMLYVAMANRNSHLLEECGDLPQTSLKCAEKAGAIWRKLVSNGKQAYREYLESNEELINSLRSFLARNDRQQRP